MSAAKAWRKIQRWAVPAALLALALTSGCASYTTFKTARTLPPGRSRVVVATQLQGAGTTDGQSAPMPELVLGVRRGLSHRLEVDATGTLLPLGDYLTAASAEVSGKRQLWESADGRWSIAAGAGLGYRITTSSGAVFEAVHFALPLMLGWNIGPHQLVLSPTVGAQRWYGTGAVPVNLPFAGASLGFSWQVSRRVALMPEATWAESSARNYMTSNSRLFHVGLAVVIGAR
jgi:hypothetical protein